MTFYIMKGVCFSSENIVVQYMHFNIMAALTAAHAHAHGEFDILDILLDALIDTAKMLPFLFLAFLLMEFIEHKAGERLEGFLKKTGGARAGGAVAGALLGCVPQCGFSAAAANLYSGRLITMGTLIAVFISTSDEAIPILLAHPDKLGAMWRLMAAKVIIAAAAGIIIDIIARIAGKNKEEQPDYADLCADCGCENHSIWYSALIHTIKITIFILIINLVLGALMSLAGEEAMADMLGRMGIFQPFAAGLVGLIPNCAASVLITELYADGAIGFGSAVAGLSAGAGVGLAVLFRSNKNMKQNLLITGLVYFIGVLSGLVFNIFAY